MPITIAIDLDHTLAQLLPVVVEWHNAEKSTALTAADIHDLSTLFGTTSKERNERMSSFYQSSLFKTNIIPMEHAYEILQPLRKYFTFLAITNRPRSVEVVTREWLDQHFNGVFNKLVFLEEPNKEHIVQRKMDIYKELRVQVAISSDGKVLDAMSESLERSVLMKTVPWSVTKSTKVIEVMNWTNGAQVLETIIKELNVKPLDQVMPGPKLARFTDDLVSISHKKPVSFYASMIRSKLILQKQGIIRVEAIESAIPIAVQVVELLRSQNCATISKISTSNVSYPLKRSGTGKYRTSKMEIVIKRV